MFLRLCVAALMAAFLTACASVDDRGRDPIPPQMLALMKARGMTARDPILIRIHKQESELELWKRDRSGRYALLKTYPMCRWSGKLGPKMAEGDRQAPEGFYEVTASMLNPRSQFNLSFNLGFPNRLEKSLGWQGSALMVHGACSSSGCYAMTDQAIGEIYAVAREALAAGQASFQVQALPFRMTAENLALHRNDPNLPFWRNLKQGSDRFALSRQPPVIGYCGQRYIFDAQAADGMAMDPLSPCPVLQQADPSLEDKLAELTRTDDSRLAASGGPVMAMTYTDGGMHPVFRDILRTSGPDRLSKMTSSKVKVSRPQAALADPYRAGSAGH